CVEQDDKGWDARKRAYCLKIQPATGSFARNLIYSTKPIRSDSCARDTPMVRLTMAIPRPLATRARALSLIWRYSYCPVFQGATSDPVAVLVKATYPDIANTLTFHTPPILNVSEKNP
ncbi:hypothetical protein AB8R19_26995, partial [Klebsiella pneumoniae]